MEVLVTCCNCGLTFAVPIQIIEGYDDVYCPECGEEIPPEDLEDA